MFQGRVIKASSSGRRHFAGSLFILLTLRSCVLIFVLLLAGLSSCTSDDEDKFEAVDPATEKAIENIPEADTIPEDTQRLSISFLMGEVKVLEPNTAPKRARVNMHLRQSTTIQTVGSNSRCDLKVPSGSIIRLSGNTKLQLAKLYKDDKLNVEKTGLEMLSGMVYVKVRPLVNNEEFTVKTRTASVGVRGTKFAVADEEENGDNVTSVYVDEGEVAVSRNLNLKLGDETANEAANEAVAEESRVIVKPNQSLRVSRRENRTLRSKIQSQLSKGIAAGARRQQSRAAVRKLVRRKARKLARQTMRQRILRTREQRPQSQRLRQLRQGIRSRMQQGNFPGGRLRPDQRRQMDRNTPGEPGEQQKKQKSIMDRARERVRKGILDRTLRKPRPPEKKPKKEEPPKEKFDLFRTH